MEWQYRRPTAKSALNSPTLRGNRGILSTTDDILNYSKHGDISKISGLNYKNKMSEILEYCYLADAFQMSNLKDEIKEIINKKMELYTNKKQKSIERKSGNIYIYNSKPYDVEYDCNCEKILDIFKDTLQDLDTKLKSARCIDGINSFRVYIYYIEYLRSLITEYLMYRKDRTKIIDTIYTIYKYISTNIELYVNNISDNHEGINVDNVDYLLNIVDPIYKSKIIEMLEVDSWSGTNRWENIKNLESVCKKYNLEYVFLDKVKAYFNYFYDSNDHRHSKL